MGVTSRLGLGLGLTLTLTAAEHAAGLLGRVRIGAHLHDLGLERGTLAPHATHALLGSLEPATKALVRALALLSCLARVPPRLLVEALDLVRVRVRARVRVRVRVRVGVRVRLGSA